MNTAADDASCESQPAVSTENTTVLYALPEFWIDLWVSWSYWLLAAVQAA